MTDEDQPNLAQEAANLLDELYAEFSPTQVAMLLGAAQQFHMIQSSTFVQQERILRGDHLEHDPAER